MRNRSNLIVCSSIIAGALAAIAPTGAHAQDATGAAADASGGGDIIVTAQRRSENLQTVPVAISVVSGASLAAGNVNNVESLDQKVASLTFKRGTGNVNSAIAIRGIGTQTFASGAEPSVSVVIDGVVYGRSGMATQEFADIDRVEVLRGPQGTLFGKNASAGALNMVTRNPGSELHASGSVAYFDRKEVRVAGSVSGPLTQNISALVSGYYGNYDGNVRNVYNNTYVNGYDRYGFKAKLVADLENVKITLAGDSSHNKDDCCADVLGNVIPNAQWTNLVLPAQLPNVPRFGNRSINNNFAPGTVDTNRGVSLTVDLSLGDHTLTSISAYRQWKNRQLRDGDFGSVSGTYTQASASQILDQQDNGFLDFNQYSEELRLTSPSGGRVEYVIGAFFWRTKEYDTFTRTDNYCSASTLPADANGFVPCSTAPGASTFVTATGPASWETKFANTAGFGQLTFKLTDALKVIAGLRYTHDEVSYAFRRTNFLNGVQVFPVSPPNAAYPGIQTPFSYAEKADADGVSGKFGLQYQANDDTMVYATYSRGYKGPALNVFYSLNGTPTNNNTGPIAPERSNAYEVGFKTRLLDRRLTLNAALFRQDLNNFQSNSFVTQAGQTFVTLTNAGRVRSQGFEMDFTLRPVDSLSISGGYTYNEGTIREFRCNAAALTPAQLATCVAHNGKPLPFAPKHKLNLAVEYALPLGDAAPFDVKLGTNLAYSSRVNFDLDQAPHAQQPPYALVDANITFSSKDERYALSLIGKNLFDKYYTSFITPVGNGVSALSYQRLQVPRDAERYFGARLSFKY